MHDWPVVLSEGESRAPQNACAGAASARQTAAYAFACAATNAAATASSDCFRQCQFVCAPMLHFLGRSDVRRRNRLERCNLQVAHSSPRTELGHFCRLNSAEAVQSAQTGQWRLTIRAPSVASSRVTFPHKSDRTQLDPLASCIDISPIVLVAVASWQKVSSASY